MSIITTAEVAVSTAIRQALETDANPGNTVQSPSGNPAQIHLNGFFDVLKIARNAISAYKAHLAHEASVLEAAAKAEAKRVEEAAAAELEKAKELL